MIAGCGVDDTATLDCVFFLIAKVIIWSLAFAEVVAVFFIIFAGIRILTSGGDPKTLDTGKKTLTYAIVGVIVVFCSFLIVSTIAAITGVACLDPNHAMSFTACNN